MEFEPHITHVHKRIWRSIIVLLSVKSHGIPDSGSITGLSSEAYARTAHHMHLA